MFFDTIFYIDLLVLIMVVLAVFIIWFFYNTVQNAKKMEAAGTKICYNCQSTIKIDDEFCSNCGKQTP